MHSGIQLTQLLLELLRLLSHAADATTAANNKAYLDIGGMSSTNP